MIAEMYKKVLETVRFKEKYLNDHTLNPLVRAKLVDEVKADNKQLEELGEQLKSEEIKQAERQRDAQFDDFKLRVGIANEYQKELDKWLPEVEKALATLERWNEFKHLGFEAKRLKTHMAHNQVPRQQHTLQDPEHIEAVIATEAFYRLGLNLHQLKMKVRSYDWYGKQNIQSLPDSVKLTATKKQFDEWFINQEQKKLQLPQELEEVSPQLAKAAKVKPAKATKQTHSESDVSEAEGQLKWS